MFADQHLFTSVLFMHPQMDWRVLKEVEVIAGTKPKSPSRTTRGCRIFRIPVLSKKPLHQSTAGNDVGEMQDGMYRYDCYLAKLPMSRNIDSLPIWLVATPYTALAKRLLAEIGENLGAPAVRYVYPEFESIQADLLRGGFPEEMTVSRLVLQFEGPEAKRGALRGESPLSSEPFKALKSVSSVVELGFRLMGPLGKPSLNLALHRHGHVKFFMRDTTSFDLVLLLYEAILRKERHGVTRHTPYRPVSSADRADSSSVGTNV